MSFLQPAFLYGLIAVIIPIVVHLFDFRRTRKVYYSNIRLLRQVQQASQSVHTLRHWLILVSRILFIILLVLAFARPYLPPPDSSRLGANRVGIFIDNSPSMSNTVGADESGLEAARQLAGAMLELYPPGTEFIVQPAYDEKSAFLYMSRQEAAGYLERLGYSSRHRPLADIIGHFGHTYNEQIPAEIILISDFQKSTLFSRPLPADSTSRYLLLPVRFPQYRNLAIDTVYISNPLELDQSQHQLVVEIRHYGRDEARDIPVRLFAGERQLAVASVSLAAGQRTTLTFNIGRELYASPAGRLVIEDYPVAFDNEFFFSLGQLKPLSLVIIEGRTPSPYIEAVYGNRQLYRMQTMPASHVDFRVLAQADMVVLNQVEELPEGLLLSLVRFRDNGGTLLVVPAHRQEADSYRALLPGLQATNLQEAPVPLQTPDFSRPFFRGIVERQTEPVAMPQARAVWSWGRDRNALLRFVDGRPYLSEAEPGLYVLASPLLDSLSGFPTNALFVPVMYRLAARARQTLEPLYYRLGTPAITLTLPELAANDLIRLVKDDLTIIPDQRISRRQVRLLLPGAHLPPGHYQVVVNDRPLKLLALNSGAAESDVTAADSEELAGYCKSLDFKLLEGPDTGSLLTAATAAFKGIELWRYFLAGALLFLLAEALLIRLR